MVADLVMKYRLRSTIENGKTVLRVVTNAQFSEGDKVDTPDGLGVISGVWEESWSVDDDEEVEASSDSPAYSVALIDGRKGFGHYPESDVSEAGDEWPDVDVDDPAGDLAEATGEAENVATQGVTDWDYPPSWRESERPNRVILLDAWSSMGGQFDCGGGCCKSTMRQAGLGERASDQFCASMKDRALGTELWRGWGP